MKQIRRGVFETNSSSTHSISLYKNYKWLKQNYLPVHKEFVIRFIDTDVCNKLITLQDKVSYLVSHLISNIKYEVETYDELVEYITENYYYKDLFDFVLKKYNKTFRFPKSYKGDLEEIVNINHQLRESCLEDVLSEIICGDYDHNWLFEENQDELRESDFETKLEFILRDDTEINIGRD